MTSSPSEPPAAAPHAALGRRGDMLKAVRLTSAASLLTVFFGIATNKLVALTAGSGGIALIGIYRTLAYLTSTIGLIGITDVVTRGISRSKSRDETIAFITAAVQFALVPIAVIFATALLLASPIARAMFGAGGETHTTEVRVAIVLSTALLTFALVQAILNGQGAVRQVTVANIALSLATLVFCYPLLSLGNLGLPVLVTIGPIAGTLAGVYFIREANDLGAAHFRLRSFADVHATIPVSVALVLHPFVATASALLHQSIMARGYGLDVLGLYNAATTFETTAIAMLTASMRSYFLPTLGKLEDLREKSRLAERMLVLLLAMVLAGGSILVLAAPELLRVLFARGFAGGAALVGALATSLVGQVLVWIGGMHIIQEGRFKTWLFVDIAWATMRVGGTMACVHFAAPVETAAWVHSIAFTTIGLVYVFVTRRDGVAFIGRRGVATATTVFVFLGVACWLARARAPLLVSAYILLAGAFTGVLLKHWREST